LHPLRPFLCIPLAIALCLSCLAGTLMAQTNGAPLPKVLAFYTAGGELDHVLFAQQAIRALTANAAAHGYRFAATTDWDTFTDETLKDVAIVIWLNDQPHTAAQRAAFERYMNGGGAWLGFHVSGFANAEWTWYREFLGGSRFAASHWPSLPARVNVDDPAHPVMKDVAPTFVAPINEWYAWNPSPRTNPNVKVLLTLDRSNFPLGVKNTLNGGDIPVAWTNTAYKMLYLNYGHGDRIFTSPELSAMIDNSLRWLRDLRQKD
jgi:type 1 glutamine amidotransferase